MGRVLSLEVIGGGVFRLKLNKWAKNNLVLKVVKASSSLKRVGKMSVQANYDSFNTMYSTAQFSINSNSKIQRFLNMISDAGVLSTGEYIMECVETLDEEKQGGYVSPEKVKLWVSPFFFWFTFEVDEQLKETVMLDKSGLKCLESRVC